MAFVSRTNKSKTEICSAQRSGAGAAISAVWSAPLIEGEDAAAFDQLLARIFAALKPVDIIDEIFISDVASLEWEVLRLRRLKWSLIRAPALENLLGENLGYDLYSQDFADDLAETLQHSLPERPVNSAQTLAHECARNEAHAVDKVNKILYVRGLNMNQVLDDAKDRKAKELVQEYVRREPDAVTLVHELLPMPA